MDKIIVISDDLTGACDSAACFAQHTDYADVCIDTECMPECNTDSRVGVLAVNTSTRTLGKAAAYEKVYRISKDSRLISGKIIKKIDTAFRGNVGTELKAVTDASGRNLCFIICAIPDIGRTTIDGYQYKNGIPLGDTEYSQDPIGGVKSSFIPEILMNEAGIKAGVITRNMVMTRDACDFIKSRMSQGINTFIVDAETNEDIENAYSILSQQYSESIFAGSLGLMNAVSKTYSSRKPKSISISKNIKRVIGFTASSYGVTLEQIRAAENKGLTKMLPLMIEDSPKAFDRILYEETNKAGNIFVICGTLIKDSKNPEKSEKIIRLLDGMLENLPSERYERIIFSGGETSYRVLKHFGTKKIRISCLMESTIAMGRILDGKLIGKEICLKGGSVGSEDAVIKMICCEIE